MKLDRDKLYPWLAILRAKYMGSDRARRLEAHFGSITKALKAAPEAIAAVHGFSLAIGEAVREAAQGKFDLDIDKELAWAQKEGAAILLPGDAEYPASLRQIPAHPALLYVKGELQPEDVLAFAIVGSRRASDGGKRRANQIANELAEAGLTIVSGLAWGVDASAHKGALRCKHGRTFAVMGNGLRMVYPREHEPLAEQIVKRGALISELFYDVAPQGRNFPPRNRIISGLSLGVLVVEAAERSGALITAKYALEQGKEIFALPGPVEEETAMGCNRLIKESAAALATSAQDILNELGDKIAFYAAELAGKIPRIPSPTSPVEIETKQDRQREEPAAEAVAAEKIDAPVEKAPAPPPKAPSIPLSEDEEQTLRFLTAQPKHIDSICREIGWPVSRLSSALGLLELKGLAEREAGMRFRLAE
ncbi:MAG: DNA-processing protein DprA [Candidatus Omnitrophota bacterium]